jgi:hypothetical protein
VRARLGANASRMFAPRARALSLLLLAAAPLGCARAHTRSEPGGHAVLGSSGGSGSSAYLAVDDGHLFFVDRALGAARTVATDTMSPTTLTAADVYTYPFVAADRTGFYWLEIRGGLSVVTARAHDPASTIAARGDVGPVGLAVDDGLLYFARSDATSDRIDLLEVTLATERERVLTSCAGVLGIAVDEETLFATTCRSDGGVWRIARAGGPRTPIARSTFCPMTIAIDDTRVYYTDSFGGTSGDFAVLSVPKEGGEPTLVTPTDGLAFAVHDGSVFAFDGGALVEVPIDGSPRTLLADGLHGAMGVAADDAHVFYTAADATGALVVHAAAR